MCQEQEEEKDRLTEGVARGSDVKPTGANKREQMKWSPLRHVKIRLPPHFVVQYYIDPFQSLSSGMG